MQIENIIEYADDGRKKERDFSKLEGIMIHRCGIDSKTGVVLGYKAKDIVDAFLGRTKKWDAVAKATGKQNPYTIYIGGGLGPFYYDGVIWQALPLDEVGHHGRRFSLPYLGIGLIFDGRVKGPSAKQYTSLVDLCSKLCSAWLWDPYRKIKAHGEVPGSHNGSKAPGMPAACPGDMLNMNHLRDDVAMMMKSSSLKALHDSGLVFK